MFLLYIRFCIHHSIDFSTDKAFNSATTTRRFSKKSSHNQMLNIKSNSSLDNRNLHLRASKAKKNVGHPGMDCKRLPLMIRYRSSSCVSVGFDATNSSIVNSTWMMVVTKKLSFFFVPEIFNRSIEELSSLENI